MRIFKIFALTNVLISMIIAFAYCLLSVVVGSFSFLDWDNLTKTLFIVLTFCILLFGILLLSIISIYIKNSK